MGATGMKVTEIECIPNAVLISDIVVSELSFQCVDTEISEAATIQVEVTEDITDNC